ncbi:MAG: hypothetical protein R3245_04665, partial [Kiloniellales bacterium]|nr:hypothetical protein [Kiloniellales bacterium]
MTRRASPVILVLNDRPIPLARRIASLIGAADVRGRRHRVSKADRSFEETTAELRTHFLAGRPII